MPEQQTREACPTKTRAVEPDASQHQREEGEKCKREWDLQKGPRVRDS
ncbi:MAG: hypothetical protein RTU30_13150 [Candidatus Thorarchaeota archaeon]